MRIEYHNLDGCGRRRTHVYDMPTRTQPVHGLHGEIVGHQPDYWQAVTDVPCPVCDGGLLRWAEAGYVPGYRICGGCGRHFLARGTATAPTVLRVGSRRSRGRAR